MQVLERLEGIVQLPSGKVWDVEILGARKNSLDRTTVHHTVRARERESGCVLTVGPDEETNALGIARDRAEKFVRLLGARATVHPLDGRIEWRVRFDDGSTRRADNLWRDALRAGTGQLLRVERAA